MIFLGFAIAVAFIPGYTGATIPTQWSLMSIVLGGVTLWRKKIITIVDIFGLLFFFYAIISLWWGASFFDGIETLWKLAILVLAFWLGSSLLNLRSIYKGLAIGLSISSLLSITQWFGYSFGVLTPPGFPGLYFNAMAHGEILALVIVALITERMWLYIPMLIPGLLLSHSRGAWIAVVIGIFCTFYKKIWVLLLGLVAFFLILNFHFNTTDLMRMQIWLVAIQNFTLLGNGPGSFIGVMYSVGQNMKDIMHPEYVHNDFIQFGYEFGIGAIFIYCLYVLVFSTKKANEWPVFVILCFMSSFSFPMYMPVTAFIGALVAGRISINYGSIWSYCNYSRFNFVPRFSKA